MVVSDAARTSMRRFLFRFLLNTEFFSYFVIIPLLFIYFWVNLDISLVNLILLLQILAIVIPVSMATTYITDIMEIQPILSYFKKYYIRH